MNNEKFYQANPVVSCGEEDDGAILYNPDTDNTSVVNLSGLELWSFLKTPHTITEMADHLLQVYSNTTEAQVAKDSKQFVLTLIPEFLNEKNDSN